MTDTSFKHYARAPRYVLRPFENQLIRFSGPQNEPWEEQTEIENLSMTGLIFSAPRSLCPGTGELVKIQFEVPGSVQMACYAVVTRLETEDSSDFVKVAVKFENLLPAHRNVLRRGLGIRLQSENEDEDEMTAPPKERQFIQTAVLGLLLLGICAAWIWLLSRGGWAF